ncbi:MAG: DNA-deoxyinosine glycosylase [Candidatus Nanoarchaeia archaeon]
MISSFPPIEDENSKILILGSMPGEASLKAHQYYAHERNAFWPIMGKLLGFDHKSDYSFRIMKLKCAGIALWDVIHTCKRFGSLDSKIVHGSILTHDFEDFFKKHPKIQNVFFNGSTAENTFKKIVLQKSNLPKLNYFRLPSTSPACASLSFNAKLAQWKKIIEILHSLP